MATLVKNYTASNAYNDAVAQANSTFADYVSKWQAIARLEQTRPGETSVRVWSDKRVGKLGTYSGSGDFNAFTPGGGPAVSITADARVLGVTFQRGDMYHRPQMVGEKLTEIAGAIARTQDSILLTTLAAAFSTTYNDGTGTPYLIDNGSTLHTLADGSTTQSNQINAALSETSLNAAVTRLSRWKNYADGEPLGLGERLKVLVVPPELRTLAEKLTGSPTLGFNNGGAVDSAINPLAMDSWLVVVSPFLSNTTRWFVIDAANTPLVTAVITPPLVTMRDGANQTMIIECSGEWGAGISGPPDGLVGSSA